MLDFSRSYKIIIIFQFVIKQVNQTLLVAISTTEDLINFVIRKGYFINQIVLQILISFYGTWEMNA